MRSHSTVFSAALLAAGIGAALAGSCQFCQEASNGSPMTFDLSALPSGTFGVGSPKGVNYFISSPCENAVAPTLKCCGLADAHTSGLQDDGPCYGLGLLQANSTVDLVDGGTSGFNLTLWGSGDPETRRCGPVEAPFWGFRSSKYQFVCDPSAPATSGPSMVIEEEGCQYTVQWKHPAACGKSVSSCSSVPRPPEPPTPPPSNTSCHPKWEPTWDMMRSTILYACNASGFHDVQKAIQYGVVVYDWSNAKDIWINQHPMNDEELLTKQAEMVLAADPGIPGQQQRVWVYRNTIKALNWYTSVREKLDDPAYEGWFIKFKDYKGPSSNHSYHVPACTYEKCSGFYHDQEQTPEYPRGDGSCAEECDCGLAPCGEFVFDLRNESMHDWYINEYMISNETLLHEPIPIGLGWMDDSMRITGPTEEDSHFIEDTGSSPQDMQDMVAAYQAVQQKFNERVVELGGFTWMLIHGKGSEVTGLNATDSAKCAQTLRTDWCTPAGSSEWLQAQLYKVEPDDVTSRGESLTAEFLLTRGDYAWLGYSWLGCGANTDWPRAPEWDGDYGGKALGPCAETGSGTGVFRREYPKATVEWDCGTAAGTITMKQLDL